MGKIIEVKDLTFHYPDQKEPFFDQLSLSIERGQWVAIIGHNGSGKSTLVRIIDGLLAPQAGTIFVDGTPVTPENIWQIREKIGMVFQNPDNQFVSADVEGDVAFGMENLGLDRDVMKYRVDQALRKVNMEDFKGHDPSRLSGGQKQRVAIAGVLTLRPDVIIFDEATSMLDPEGRQDIIKLMTKLHKKGYTLISITHNIDEAVMADRVCVIDDGKIAADSSPAEIFAQEKELVAMGLDVPYSERLKDELLHNGIEVPHEYLTEKGMVDWLCKLHSKN